MGIFFWREEIEEHDLFDLLWLKMEGNVVSSSTPATFKTSDKHKLNCDRWSDDLCSNITYTKPWYRAEIKKLRAEVSKLDETLKEDKQSFSTVHYNDILPKLIKKVSKEKRASFEGLDIKGKLNGDGEVDIKRLEKFTGLYVHGISLEVEEEKGKVCVRRHHVHGSCRGIEFETTFLVEENILQDDRHDTASGIYVFSNDFGLEGQVYMLLPSLDSDILLVLKLYWECLYDLAWLPSYLGWIPRSVSMKSSPTNISSWLGGIPFYCYFMPLT